MNSAVTAGEQGSTAPCEEDAVAPDAKIQGCLKPDFM